MDSRKAKNQETKHISHLPPDVKHKIYSYLNSVDCFNLMRASPRLFSTATATLHKRKDHPLRKLLSHAALGEWGAAESLWLKNTHLLTHRGTVYHPNRIYSNGAPDFNIPNYMNPGRYKYKRYSAWQIAMVNSEFKVASEMAKFIDPQELQKQFEEIFPDGKIVKYDSDIYKIKDLLCKLFDEIITESNIRSKDVLSLSLKTRTTLYALYDSVKPKGEHTVGLVFDVHIYYEALQLYSWRYHEIDLTTEKGKHQDMFWHIHVEEYLASLLGTRFLRTHAQGWLNTTNLSGCNLFNATSYFPFRRERQSIPGNSFYVGEFGFLIGNENVRYSHPSLLKLEFLIISIEKEAKDLIVQYSLTPKKVSPLSSFMCFIS